MRGIPDAWSRTNGVCCVCLFFVEVLLCAVGEEAGHPEERDDGSGLGGLSPFIYAKDCLRY